MIEYKRVMRYCEHYYLNQLKDTRVGLKLAIIGFALFVYADFFVFDYPRVITALRGVLIIYYSIVLAMTYIFEKKRNLLRIAVSSSLFFSLLFGSFVAVYLSQSSPDMYYRASQVFILITIGSILFAGITKPYLNYLISTNLLVYIISISMVLGFSVEVLFQNFNLIFLSVATLIFNYLYIRSRIYEFEASEEKNNKIEELKSEIINRQRLQYQLKEMATYDGLTKAYTRAVGLSMLEKNMFKADEEYKSLSIIYMDVNGLKVINDTYGHKVGDTYIVGLVEIINQFTRTKDYCIRLGGDEFLVVLPNTSYFEAEHMWRIIAVEMSKFDVEEENRSIPLQVSHGIAEYTNNNYPTIEYFLDAADDKMYKEKKKSKRKLVEESLEM